MPQFLDLEDIQETKKKFLDLEDLPQDEPQPNVNPDLVNFTNETNRVIPQIARNPQTYGADTLPFRDKARYVADQWLQSEPKTPVIENGVPIGRLPVLSGVEGATQQPQTKQFLDLEDLPEDIPVPVQSFAGEDVAKRFQPSPTWMNGIKQPVQKPAPLGGVLDLNTISPSSGKMYIGQQAPQVASTETPELDTLKLGYADRVEPIVGANLIKPAPLPEDQRPGYTMLNPTPEDVSGEQKLQVGKGTDNWIWPVYKSYKATPDTALETFHKALDIPMHILTSWTGGRALNADKLAFYGISKAAPELTGGDTSLTEAMERLNPYQRGKAVEAMGDLARFVGEIQSTGKALRGIKSAISPQGTELVKWTPEMFPPKQLSLYKSWIKKTADKLPSWALSGTESSFIESLTQDNDAKQIIKDTLKETTERSVAAATWSMLEAGGNKVIGKGWEYLVTKHPDIAQFVNDKIISRMAKSGRKTPQEIQEMRDKQAFRTWVKTPEGRAAEIAKRGKGTGEAQTKEPISQKPEVQPETPQFNIGEEIVYEVKGGKDYYGRLTNVTQVPATETQAAGILYEMQPDEGGKPKTFWGDEKNIRKPVVSAPTPPVPPVVAQVQQTPIIPPQPAITTPIAPQPPIKPAGQQPEVKPTETLPVGQQKSIISLMAEEEFSLLNRETYKPNETLNEYDYGQQKWVTGEAARQEKIKARKQAIEILQSDNAERFIASQPSPQNKYTVSQALQNEKAELSDLESMGILKTDKVPADWKSSVKDTANVPEEQAARDNIAPQPPAEAGKKSQQPRDFQVFTTKDKVKADKIAEQLKSVGYKVDISQVGEEFLIQGMEQSSFNPPASNKGGATAAEEVQAKKAEVTEPTKEIQLKYPKDVTATVFDEIAPFGRVGNESKLDLTRRIEKSVRYLKGFIREVPEFSEDPVFTVIGGKLVYQDGGRFRFEPKLFGIKPENLIEGQKVRVDLESYEIKQPSKKAIEKAKSLGLKAPEEPAKQYYNGVVKKEAAVAPAKEVVEKPPAIQTSVEETTQAARTSMGAAGDVKLDQALKRAFDETKTKTEAIYTQQVKGKWVNTKTEPTSGDYFVTKNGITNQVKGKQLFESEPEAIKTAQRMADNTQKPVYVADTDKGFELTTSKPEIEHTEVLPKGEGLTKEERAILSKQQAAEAVIAQQEGQKVGYKKGSAEAKKEAKKKMQDFQLAIALTEKNRQDAIDVVKDYVPSELQGKYINRIMAAKTSDRVQKLTEAINEYIERADKQSAITELKNFLTKTKKDYQSGKIVLGKLRDKTRQVFLDFLKQYDLSRLSQRKQITLERRKEYVEIVADIQTLATRLSTVLDSGAEGVARDIILMGHHREELDRLSKTPLRDLKETLTANQIRSIQGSLQHLLEVNELKGNIKARMRAEKLRDDINAGTKEVSPSSAVKPSGEVIEIFPAMKYLVKNGQARIDKLIGFATGKTNAASMKVLWDDPEQGLIDTYGKYKEFTEYAREQLDKIGFTQKDYDGFDKLVTVTLGGKEMKLPIRYITSLYAHAMSDDNLPALLKTKGLNIRFLRRDLSTGFLKLGKSYRTRTPTLREIKDAFTQLPDIYKRFVEEVVFDTNYNVQRPALNEVSVGIQNYEIARSRRYFHLDREVAKPISGQIVDISKSIEKQGRYLSRIGGTARINLTPIDIEFMEGMQSDAEYYGMTIPMQNARTMLVNEKFREAMKRSGHERVLGQIETLIKRSEGVFADQSLLEQKLGHILGNIGKSILSLRISGGVVQLSSPPASWGEIEPIYFVGTRPPLPKEIKHLMDISPMLWHRWKGRSFDYVLGDLTSRHAFETMMFDKTPLTEKLLGQYTIGDMGSIGVLYQAIENKIAAETNLKRGTPEFEKAAVQLLHKTMKTQGMYENFYRSDITSNPSVALRGSTMFMSTMNSFYNTVIGARDDFAKGRITLKKYSEAVGGVATSLSMAAIMRALFAVGVTSIAAGVLGFIFPEQKKRINEVVKNMAIKRLKRLPQEIVFQMAGMVVFGQMIVANAKRGIDVLTKKHRPERLNQIQTGNVFTDVGLDFADAGVQWLKTTREYLGNEKDDNGKSKWLKTLATATDSTINAVTEPMGLPYSGPKSDFYYPAKTAWTEMKKSDMDLLKEESRQFEKEQESQQEDKAGYYYNDLYKALQKGDLKAMNDNIQKALKSGAKPEGIISAMQNKRPLPSLSATERAEYKKTLTKEKLATLTKAEQRHNLAIYRIKTRFGKEP